VTILKTILLKFSGPLQSWGTNSHFETRYTDAHPSKSGVIGLVAAGLGISRDDNESLTRLNSLSYAVRVDQPGQIMKDYHTAKKYKKNGEFERTYVTTRFYIQDAVFVIALSGDEKLIDEVKTSITEPYFSLFLGRRSLPPTADIFLGVFCEDAITLLKTYDWQASDWYKRKNANYQYYIYADESLLSEGKIQIRNDVALSFSQIKGRKFSPRKEVSVPIEKKRPPVHDAFEAVGE
jgi:CRISPR system Cascade subunit CasD